ncbi:2352_t:CDS:1 [Acaulospora morrowiae]|uniref:2352_t:CDS:1 n=1 Tax=Acaulospora morrowiae TaxID=94023 RepID=A0A9N8VBI3_9GLOM|nr:2352_t:CDS:1 [Acaulospora morrowiae]
MANYQQPSRLLSPLPQDHLQALPPVAIPYLIPQQILTPVSTPSTSQVLVPATNSPLFSQHVIAPAAIFPLTAQQIPAPLVTPSTTQEFLVPEDVLFLTSQRVLDPIETPLSINQQVHTSAEPAETLPLSTQRVITPAAIPPLTSGQVSASSTTSTSQQVIDPSATLPLTSQQVLAAADLTLPPVPAQETPATIPTLSYQQSLSTTTTSFLIFRQNQLDLIQGNTFPLSSTQTLKPLDFKEMLFKGDNNLYRNE